MTVRGGDVSRAGAGVTHVAERRGSPGPGAGPSRSVRGARRPGEDRRALGYGTGGPSEPDGAGNPRAGGPGTPGARAAGNPRSTSGQGTPAAPPGQPRASHRPRPAGHPPAARPVSFATGAAAAAHVVRRVLRPAGRPGPAAWDHAAGHRVRDVAVRRPAGPAPGVRVGQFVQIAEDQRLKTESLPALRGNVTAADGQALAITVETYLVYADPVMMSAAQQPEVAADLAGPLGMTEPEILGLLQHPTSPQYVVLKKNVSQQTADQIKALELPGATEPAPRRHRHDDHRQRAARRPAHASYATSTRTAMRPPTCLASPTRPPGQPDRRGRPGGLDNACSPGGRARAGPDRHLGEQIPLAADKTSRR